MSRVDWRGGFLENSLNFLECQEGRDVRMDAIASIMMKHFIISVHAVEKYSMALRKFSNQLQCPLIYGCSFIQELCSACNLVL
jgi:hypothetical protein